MPNSKEVGDTEGAAKWMRAQPNHNGKVHLFGSCSGGRHAFIYACQRKDVDACTEPWSSACSATRIARRLRELSTLVPSHLKQAWLAKLPNRDPRTRNEWEITVERSSSRQYLWLGADDLSPLS